MEKGRRELERLSGEVDLAIADSQYNREELVELGFKNTVTVPLLIDYSRYDISPESSIMTKYRDGSVNLVFVGRIGPNKKQEDVIRVFSIYRKYINDRSRLFIVGPSRQVPDYNALLNRLVDSLGVEDVHLTGEAGQTELNAYYSIADVFVSMSEHEGFCIPLIECMHFGVPILAYESSAVTDTLDGSGILFAQKDLGRVAEMIDIVVKDKNVRERIVDGQKKRLEFFRRDRVEEQFLNCLAGLLN
jgi:glycosyltransferase involved in cell wall biosynthesis